jgi:hypothetical protein
MLLFAAIVSAALAADPPAGTESAPAAPTGAPPNGPAESAPAPPDAVAPTAVAPAPGAGGVAGGAQPPAPEATAPTTAAAPPAANAAPTSPVDADGLRALVEELAPRIGAPVLVTAAGPAAEAFAVDALVSAPTGTARIVRVGILGDVEAEVGRAREAARVACALRVAEGDGGWLASQHGDCGAAAAPAELPPEEREKREAEWRAASLERVTSPRGAAIAWTVRDGRGDPLDAVGFARATGDLATERRIAREAPTAKAMSWGLGVAGGALLAAGLGVLATRGAGAPLWDDYVVNATEFGSSDAYLAAVADAETRYLADTEQYEIRRDDRAWTAGFLSLSGLVTLGAAPFAQRGAAERAKDPAWYWSVEEADRLVVAHNAALRARMGLPPIGAPKIDEAAKAAPASGPAAPALEDAPDEPDDGPGESDEAPSAPDDAPEEAP